MSESTWILLLVRDRRGRQILLTAERWAHIVERHPELRGALPALAIGIQAPDEIRPGRGPQQEWFYLKEVGPSRWLKVVVAWDTRSSGRIITAFPRREKP